VRIVVVTPRSFRNRDGLKRLNGFAFQCATGGKAVGRATLGHLAADGHDRVERRHRLLEDHGDLTTAQSAKTVRRRAKKIDARGLVLVG
jgi:hypothetical protein